MRHSCTAAPDTNWLVESGKPNLDLFSSKCKPIVAIVCTAYLLLGIKYSHSMHRWINLIFNFYSGIEVQMKHNA